MKKRFIIFACVFTILFGAVNIGTYAQSFPDVVGKPYERAVETLKAFGILMGKSEDNFDGESNITRAEMVTVVLKLKGFGYTVQTETVFDDVPKEHWASGMIALANDLEYVKGISETEFRPDDNVTYEEATAILVRALGYEIMAEEQGGFPGGYTKTAQDLDLYDKVSLANGFAPRWAVAQMAYNALEVELYDVDKIVGSDVSYSGSGKTILSEVLKLKKLEGIVAKNEISSINYAEQGIGEGRVEIGGTVLTVGETDISDYLGYYVEVYYRDDYDAEDDGEIKLYFLEDKFGDTLEIEYDDDTSMEHTGSTLSFTYFEENRRKTVEASDTCFIYNKMAISPSDIDTYFMPEIDNRNFKITLVKNDGDSKCDVVIIDDYSSYQITNVNEYDEVLRLKKYSSSAPGEFDLKNIEYKIYDDRNREIEFADLQMNNIISVFKTVDGSRYEMYVSNKTVEGSISRVTEDGFEINQTEYYTTGAFPEDLLSLNLNAVYYVDIYGDIAGFNEIASGSGSYGMLMNVASGDISDEFVFKILTADNKLKTYQSEAKIIAYNPSSGNVEETAVSDLIYTGVTSEGYSTETEKYALWHTNNIANFIEADTLTDYTAPFYTCLNMSDSEKSKAASRKPVYYELNSDGKIRKIIVPDVPGETRLRTLNNEGRYSYTYRPAYNMVFDSENNTTATPYYRIDENPTVFSVLATAYEDRNYSASRGIGAMQKNIANKMRLYSTNSDDEANIVVNYSVLPGEGLADTPYVVVRSIGMNDEGSLVLYGYSEGKEYNAVISDGTRLVERKPNFSSSNYTQDTKLNSENLADGSAIKMYDATTIESLIPTVGNTVTIDENTLKKGDIVIVGKNGGSEICYVEMAMRAEDGVMLITSSQSSYYARMSGADYLGKGTVMEITDKNEYLVDITGEYNAENRRQVSMSENYRYTLLFNDRNVPYSFENSGNIWIFDYSDCSMQVVNSSVIKEGDNVMIRGAASKPKDCIILRNYPW